MKCEDSHRDTSEIFLDRLNPMETTHSIYCAHSKFTECTILSELSLAMPNCRRNLENGKQKFDLEFFNLE